MNILDQIDAEIDRLQAAKAVIAKFVHQQVHGTHNAPRGKAKGTDAIVLSVMRDGANTLAGITKAAKVKPNTARVAVLALEAAGKVKREGKGSKTRYLVS